MQIPKRFKYYLGGTAAEYEAALKKEEVPDIAIIELRRPEVSERNEYNDRLYPTPNAKDADLYGAGLWLIDTIVVSITNLFDGETEITLENKAMIPVDIKADLATRIMNRSDIKDVKN